MRGKLLIIIIILAIGLLAFAPPNAEFMPEEKRFAYVTFPILPPLLAIVLAIYTQQVLPALFAGIWVAALMVYGYNPLSATIETWKWIVSSITDSWNATILVFDFLIGSMVALLYASGSMYSLAEVIGKRVKSARTASIMASILGIIVFFDDYSNTIVVGNSMRPLTDKHRVSRELLSYIVDSTAAPVAGLMIVSTWIGYEVQQINGALDVLKEQFDQGLIPAAPDISGYGLWLTAVPFHFYSILAVILVFLVAATRRHFGPMLKAEYRALTEGKVLRDGAQPLMPTESVLGEAPREKRASYWIFLASVLGLIVVTLIGMWYTGAMVIIEDEGLEAAWWEIDFTSALMNADAATALLWGSFTGFLIAFVGALYSRVLTFRKAMEYTLKGMYLMVYANAILVLAWTIKTATQSLGTADYVVTQAVSANVPALLVPLIIFLISMFISYTTGTSWGTFALMMPIAIPLAWRIALIQYDDINFAYMLAAASIGAVFGGGIYGDHVSPISDTTIMSSMFSGSDHIDHVTTQMPYGTFAAGVSIILYLLFAAGLTTPLILLPVGVILLVLGHRVLNKYYSRKTGLPEVLPDFQG
ncbi:Na+/H+ antiporter NhaC family protein [Thermosphaera aggregans]|jgi:NhaC family Na+:H+ antiporter|uniref:Transporter, NhaC family (TC 2.A.35) n=1 Tax=Thermosphaera aggregans (strain DSM 11486 / M11TL) TaxID=633148 RepID=D5TZY8_THEAM|nr:Na+/H+ antiporter NhaC family protein [Thermosphaera aggregans]ADG90438.1 transporter, NhaC family (TC 2.A.35) [Thermosphaera aggregans DSM 11486]